MSWKIVSFQSLCVICFLGFLMGSCCAAQLVFIEMKVFFYFICFLGFLLGSYCATQLVFVEMEGFFSFWVLTVFLGLHRHVLLPRPLLLPGCSFFVAS